MPRIQDNSHSDRRPEAGRQAAPPDRSYTPGGPVGAMHENLSARLNEGEYETWLLPPEARTPLEGAVHWLSLGAGVIALTAGAVMTWLIFGMA